MFSQILSLFRTLYRNFHSGLCHSTGVRNAGELWITEFIEIKDIYFTYLYCFLTFRIYIVILSEKKNNIIVFIFFVFLVFKSNLQLKTKWFFHSSNFHQLLQKWYFTPSPSRIAFYFSLHYCGNPRTILNKMPDPCFFSRSQCIP